ncbi:MAG: hypothetical protein ACI35W_05850 [Anaeroplasmataceae bacterium]
MLKLSKEAFKTIEFQMFNRARDIDVALFNVLFSNDMPLMYVSTALSGYQNKDGGFAHALEIDNYNKDSSVYQVYEALRIVKQAGFKNINEDPTLLDMLKKAFNYLYNRLDKWEAIIPSNNNSVCASWFKYNETNLASFGDAPKPAILGYTLFLTDSNNPYYKKAYKMSIDIIERFLNKEEVTKEEFISYKAFIECITEKELFSDKLDALKKKLFDFASKMVERDKDKFNTYCNLPLEMFDSYTEDEAINELIDEHLDYIINSVASHGLWEPNFYWDNDQAEASTAQIKWMGVIAIRNILWLRKFNRLEE